MLTSSSVGGWRWGRQWRLTSSSVGGWLEVAGNLQLLTRYK